MCHCQRIVFDIFRRVDRRYCWPRAQHNDHARENDYRSRNGPQHRRLRYAVRKSLQQRSVPIYLCNKCNKIRRFFGRRVHVRGVLFTVRQGVDSCGVRLHP